MIHRYFPSFLKIISATFLTTIPSTFHAEANTPLATPPCTSSQASSTPAPTTPPTAPKKQAEVIIYSSSGCPHCVSAKNFFDEKNISYKVVDIQWKKDLIDDMEKHTGKRSVPQILINGKHVGGYLALLGLDLTGEMDELLAQPPQAAVAKKAPSTPIKATPVNTTQ